MHEEFSCVRLIANLKGRLGACEGLSDEQTARCCGLLATVRPSLLYPFQFLLLSSYVKSYAKKLFRLNITESSLEDVLYSLLKT